MKKGLRIVKGLAACLLVCVISVQVYADSLEDAQQKKEDAEADKSQAEQILSNLESSKNDLEVWISELDQELAKIQARISDLNEKKADLIIFPDKVFFKYSCFAQVKIWQTFISEGQKSSHLPHLKHKSRYLLMFLPNSKSPFVTP